MDTLEQCEASRKRELEISRLEQEALDSRKMVIQFDVDGVTHENEICGNDIYTLLNHIRGTVQDSIEELDELNRKFHSIHRTSAEPLEALKEIYDQADDVENVIKKYENLNNKFEIVFDINSEYFELSNEDLIESIDSGVPLSYILHADGDNDLVLEMYKIITDLEAD